MKENIYEDPSSTKISIRNRIPNGNPNTKFSKEYSVQYSLMKEIEPYCYMRLSNSIYGTTFYRN